MNAALLVGVLLAQAEAAPPAPLEPLPPGSLAPPISAPESPSDSLAVFGRFAYRIPSDDNQLSLNSGYSLGGQYQHRYHQVAAATGPTLDLGLAVSFFYDKFATPDALPTPLPGAEESRADDTMITQTSFAASQVVSLPFSRLRPWVSAGAGMTFGYFSTRSSAVSPGSTSVRQPLLTAGAGLAVAIGDDVELALRADFMHPLTHPVFTPTRGRSLALFGDLLDIGAGLFYRF